MGPASAQLLLSYPVEQLYALLAFGMLRTLGMTFGLFPMLWAMGTMVTLRVAIAFALSLPLFFANGAAIVAMASAGTTFELALLSPKELVIGFALGLLVSLPIHALQFAGSITDSYRGEQIAGAPWPDGTMVQTFSLLYVPIGIFVFAASGGFWRIIEALYLSFEFWPVDQMLPQLTTSGVASVTDLLSTTLVHSIVIAAPLLALMFLAEIVLMIAAKLAPGYVPFSHIFLIKNLIAIVILPLLVIVIWQGAQTALFDAPNPLDLLRLVFP